MQSGANHPTGPSGRDEYNRQAYSNPLSYQGHPDASSAQVAPVEGDMTPARLEPNLSRAELRAMIRARESMIQARQYRMESEFELQTMIRAVANADREMQVCRPDSVEAQLHQGEILASFVEGAKARARRVGEGRDHGGYSEEWTINHTYRPGNGRS